MRKKRIETTHWKILFQFDRLELANKGEDASASCSIRKSVVKF